MTLKVRRSYKDPHSGPEVRKWLRLPVSERCVKIVRALISVGCLGVEMFSVYFRKIILKVELWGEVVKCTGECSGYFGARCMENVSYECWSGAFQKMRR